MANETNGKGARRTWLWLVLGLLLIPAAHLRWGVGALAWIAPVPLLAYLRRSDGVWPRLALLGGILAAWVVALLKIVTPPLPAVAAVGFGLGVGAFHALPYLGWDLLRRRASPSLSLLSFPALVAVAEWLQAHLTPVGSWGATAYTQLDDLPLLQVAALAGPAGVAVLVAGVAAALEHGLAHAGAPRRFRPLAAAAAAVAAAHVYGAARLAPIASDTVTVAAVGTDATFGGLPLPSKEELRRIDQALVERTRRAARAGARLVAWNEGATLVMPDEETAFVAALQRVAREERVELIAAYIMPLSFEPLRYENKYTWIRTDGTIDHTYLKHHPVPGEPAVRGEEPARLVASAAGPASGAICYDYDFFDVARAHARLGAHLVLVPSSDWRGIDPIHTEMAALRAIEGGYSILRSTRLGLSAGIDPTGRLRGWLSFHETSERVLLVSLPVGRRPTLYALTGDLLVALCAAFVAGLVALSVTGRRGVLRA